MKIIAIGDTHGKSIWKLFTKKEFDADRIIFIGDYFDSFDIAYREQMKNFLEILTFKKDNPDKVTLLLGNHDYHYILESERYSGYQDEYAFAIGAIIQKAINEDLITIGTREGDYIFTHAGITNTWAKNNGVEIFNKPTREMWAMLKNCPEVFKFTEGENHSNFGDDITQSPIWVRPESLMSDPLDSCGERIIQVVGHTKFKQINIEGRFIFIDVLDFANQYLIINNGTPEIGEL